MSSAVVRADAVESVLIQGDLSKFTPEQRTAYYQRVCDSLGLNPLTQPFAYLTLNNKLVLYAKRDCTEQLRKRDKVSVSIVAREVAEGVYVVRARATTPDGRADESVGAVAIDTLKGEARANAMMKAETKAKRRVTMSICGLGMMDETEVQDISGARQVQAEPPRQLPAAEPAEPDESPFDPVTKLDDYNVLARQKGKRWADAVTWLNTNLGTGYPTNIPFLSVPEAERRALVAELDGMPDAVKG